MIVLEINLVAVLSQKAKVMQLKQRIVLYSAVVIMPDVGQHPELPVLAPIKVDTHLVEDVVRHPVFLVQGRVERPLGIEEVALARVVVVDKNQSRTGDVNLSDNPYAVHTAEARTEIRTVRYGVENVVLLKAVTAHAQQVVLVTDAYLPENRTRKTKTHRSAIFPSVVASAVARVCRGNQRVLKQNAIAVVVFQRLL